MVMQRAFVLLVVVALVLPGCADGFRRLVKQDPPPAEEFGSVEDACLKCLDGHTKSRAMPWCSCMAREDDGHFHSQCVRPKTSGGFYACMCAKDVPDQATGFIKPVGCTPLDPFAEGLEEKVDMLHAR